MPGIRRDVDRDRLARRGVRTVDGEIRSAAILPDDDRRHALADHRERVARGVEAAIVMAVRVDEARRQREAVGIDDAFARRSGRELADGDNAVAGDADVVAPGRRAAATSIICARRMSVVVCA